MIDMNEVLDVVGGSENVLHALRTSYERPTHPYRLRRTVNRGAPLFSSELYLMILMERRIPTAEEFSEDFVTSYFPRGDKDSAKMQAKTAYKALLTDIHFYFLLAESGLFDKVEMNFSHDIFAKSDVLVTKGGVSVGLQLFSGDEAYVRTKLVSIERVKHRLSYRLHALPLKRRDDHLDASEAPMSLYETEDVYEVLGLFDREADTFEERLRPEPDVDRFVVLPQRQEAVTTVSETSSRKEIAFHSIVFGGKMDTFGFEELRRHGIKVHHIPIDVPGVTPFEIKDGDPESLFGKEEYLKTHGHLSNQFNYDQYVVEHADPTQHIAINASAGSGKTTTLIARIMYLLDMGLVDRLDQIAMITFTNEAVENMEESLAKRLIERFKTTGNPEYMRHINDLRRMDILTIPSFAKNLLSTFGHHLGFGARFRVSKMTMERRQMIERMFEEVLREGAVENPFDDMWYFEARKFLEEIWDKFEQKGITHYDLENIEMDEKESAFTKSVIKTLRRSDKELYKFKQKDDVIGVSDLTRFMKLLPEEGAPFEELSDRYRYLFVDEFQDTDISQIQSIVNILAATDIRLIAVGDVKQGIYRFRGADASAFSVLDEAMKDLGPPITYRLDENFRSSRQLVEQMERHFTSWRRSPLRLLPGEEGMVSRRETILQGDCLSLEKEDIDIDEIKQRLEEVRASDGGTGRKVLAILVRRNAEAREIGELIRADGQIKNLEVRMDGTLFESDAARDLLILINSWIHADRDDALHSLSTTAYASTAANGPHLFERRRRRGKTYMSATSTSLSLHKSWAESLERLKFSPLLPVIDAFIEKSNYKTHLRDVRTSEADILQYELNLHKIMLLIHETFADGPIDLLTLHGYLELQIATDRESDEAELDDDSFDGNPVRVLTVHRAKGLQFDTVLIPYAKNLFVRPDSRDVSDTIVHVSTEGEIDFAWRRVKRKEQEVVLDFQTERYEALRQEEDVELTREEARLLYVAMTRAEERLFIYGIDDNPSGGGRPNTWKDLLKMARRS